MPELKLEDFVIVATDEETGEAYCRGLSTLEVHLVQMIIRGDDDTIRFIKVHGFELRKKA